MSKTAETPHLIKLSHLKYLQIMRQDARGDYGFLSFVTGAQRAGVSGQLSVASHDLISRKHPHSSQRGPSNAVALVKCGHFPQACKRARRSAAGS